MTAMMTQTYILPTLMMTKFKRYVKEVPNGFRLKGKKYTSDCLWNRIWKEPHDVMVMGTFHKEPFAHTWECHHELTSYVSASWSWILSKEWDNLKLKPLPDDYETTTFHFEHMTIAQIKANIELVEEQVAFDREYVTHWAAWCKYWVPNKPRREYDIGIAYAQERIDTYEAYIEL